jgi:DNA-binding CsgD family transcriptional regulator
MVDSTRRIFAIVADVAPQEERAEAVLGELANIVAYDAAQISCWDPHQLCHRTVASRGYTDDMREALNGSMYRDDRVWRILEQRNDPVFWRDCPFDRHDSAFYVNAVESHGFKEGGTMLLRDSRGEHLGMLSLNIESSAAPKESARDLVGIIGAGLLNLVDSLAPARHLATVLPSQWPTAALDWHGRWTPLTVEGLPPLSLLEAVSDVLDQKTSQTKFRWHDSQPGAGRRRSDPLLVEVFPFKHPTCRAVVAWSRQQIPYGLTKRESDVLALLAVGASNAAIAEALSLSIRTVTTHVERILAKMEAPTRTAAALVAQHDGLINIDHQRYVV